MFTFLRNLLTPPQSSFVIDELDHLRNVVVLEDRHFSIRVEIPIGDKSLKEAKVIAPYIVLLTYQDGSTEKKRILKR